MLTDNCNQHHIYYLVLEQNTNVCSPIVSLNRLARAFERQRPVISPALTSCHSHVFSNLFTPRPESVGFGFFLNFNLDD